MKPASHPTPALLAFALLAAGCVSSPSPRAMVPPVPASFAEASGIQGFTIETAAAPETLAAWWRSFDDPVLDALIVRAAEVNHDVRLARARLREARALAGLAAAANRPALDAAASAARLRQSENSDVGRQSLAAGGHYRAGFDASWELDLFGANRVASAAARAEADAADASAHATLISVLAEVGATYIDLRGAARELALVQDTLRLQDDTLALAEDRFRAGLAAELPVAHARIQLAETRTRIPPLEAALALATHRLGVLLDRAPADLVLMPPVHSAADPLAVSARPPRLPLGLPSELLQRRPDIRQAERVFAAATSRLASARADRWPRFYLTGAAGLESVSTGDLVNAGSRFWTLGPGLRWPVLTGGRIRQTIAAQDARAEQAAIRYEQAVLRAFADVEDALVNFGRAQDRLVSAEDFSAASRRAAVLAADRHRAGLTDFLDVLAARRVCLEADQLRVQSETAASRHLVALYKSLGGGWPASDARRLSLTRAARPAVSDQKTERKNALSRLGSPVLEGAATG